MRNLMSPQAITQETLELGKAALAKSVTTSTGLVAYDLQAPAKNLYPVLTPLRNMIARKSRPVSGIATNWKVVSAIIGSGFNAMGWVPEGQRSARMSYVTSSKAANYVTLGEEDQLTFEAESAAVGFEDENSMVTMRLLQKMMQKEESALLGGNASLTLSTPTAPTLTASGTGGTLPTLTYSVIVVALTYEGYKNSSLTNGVALAQTITGADGLTFTLNGGSSMKSSATTQAVTLGQTLFASTPPQPGAAAYAWYVGAAGSEKLEAITPINTALFNAPLAGTHQAATAVTADHSANPNYAFDGLLNIALNPTSGAYSKALPTLANGVGTPLTASGKGSIVEIDTMLQYMWDNFKLSPTAFFVNSQELNNITTKVLSNSTAPLLRYNTDANGDSYSITAGGKISFYFNPFGGTGTGSKIPVIVHPEIPAGTMLAYCGELPPQYQSNEVPAVCEVLTRRDYYRIDWPLRTRQREYGVYAEEVLACYAPFAMGVIYNIGNG